MHWFGVDLHWAYTNLLPVIFQQTKCRHSAYDVLHDALLRYALLDHPDRIKQPHAYLRSIVRTVIVDDHRRMARFVPLVMDDAELYHETSQSLQQLWPDSFAPSAEHLADLQQRLHALQTIIAALPDKCRQVFWMYRVEGFSQPQIAQQMNISLKMVEAHMARAMLSLSAMCDSQID